MLRNYKQNMLIFSTFIFQTVQKIVEKNRHVKCAVIQDPKLRERVSRVSDINLRCYITALLSLFYEMQLY